MRNELFAGCYLFTCIWAVFIAAHVAQVAQLVLFEWTGQLGLSGQR